MDPDNATQEQLDAASDDREEQISAQLAAFESSIDALADNWQDEIERLLTHPVNEAGQSRIRQLAYLTSQIAAQLNRLGYTRLAYRVVGQYDQALHAADRQLEILGVPLPRLAPINEDALRAMKEIDLQKLLRLGSNTTAALTEGIVLNVIEGLPRSEIVSGVEKTLGAFSRYAQTYVDTGLNAYGRYVNWQKFSTAVSTFRFRGPLDDKTRPFCREHLNKVYTKDEIMAMDNGNLLPVWLHGGGWNCRHWWSPVVA